MSEKAIFGSHHRVDARKAFRLWLQDSAAVTTPLVIVGGYLEGDGVSVDEAIATAEAGGDSDAVLHLLHQIKRDEALPAYAVNSDSMEDFLG